MSELRTNRIVPRDGLVSGASGGIIQMAVRTTASSAQARAQYQASDENGKSYMTLIEVSA